VDLWRSKEQETEGHDVLYAGGNRSRYSSVGTVTGQRAKGQGFCFRFQTRAEIVLFSSASRPVLWPIQPHIQWVTSAVSEGVKRPGCEADQSPPSSAEV
jgi:hypothetical protein